MSDPRPRVSSERRAKIYAAYHITCPYCGAKPTYDCQSRNLWTVFPPHKSRIKAATQ